MSEECNLFWIALDEFGGTEEPPLEDELALLLERCKHPKDPTERAYLMRLVRFLASPDFKKGVEDVCEFMGDKITAAGFADHPSDYFWQPIIDGALSYTEVRNATLRDIINANDALDRHRERQALAVVQTAPAIKDGVLKGGGSKKAPTRGARARQLAKLMLETGQATKGYGGLADAAVKIKVALELDMSLGGIQNAIRDLFNT
jgi:hypothetical protein